VKFSSFVSNNNVMKSALENLLDQFLVNTTKGTWGSQLRLKFQPITFRIRRHYTKTKTFSKKWKKVTGLNCLAHYFLSVLVLHKIQNVQNLCVCVMDRTYFISCYGLMHSHYTAVMLWRNVQQTLSENWSSRKSFSRHHPLRLDQSGTV
jgi:hypothetical protein